MKIHQFIILVLGLVEIIAAIMAGAWFHMLYGLGMLALLFAWTSKFSFKKKAKNTIR